MTKIMESLQLSQEEYVKRVNEFKIDNNLYFRCKECKEIMH
jgi:hypothetical protein